MYVKKSQVTFKDQKMEITFGRIIQQILEEQNLNLMELYKELYDLGMKITYASLYSYFTGTVIPSYQTAKKILTLEKYNISDQELEEILAYSRRIFNQEKEDENELLRLHIKIKPESISKKYEHDSKTLKSIIEMRADEITGNDDLITQYTASGKRKLSSYIAYLIKKDFEENGYLIKGDE